MKPLIPLAMAMFLGLSACALTVNDVHVDYKYSKAPASDFSKSSETIRLATFEDSRGMENPRMLKHSQNLYGNTMSGGVQAEKPVAEIVRDGLVQGLTTANAHVVDNDPSVILNGDLMEYDYTVVQGFWSGTANVKLTVKLKLTDAKSGSTVWNDTLLGKASFHASSSPGEDVLFRLSLDNLVEKLQEDADFQHALHVR